VLDGFALDFIDSLFRGENRVFSRPEEDLLERLRLAGGEGSGNAPWAPGCKIGRIVRGGRPQAALLPPALSHRPPG